MVNYTEADYKRPITHTQYRHGNKKEKKGGSSRFLLKRITENKHLVEKHHVDDPEEFRFANDVFLQCPVVTTVLPMWGGGVFLFLFLLSIYATFRPSEENIELTGLIFIIVFLLGFLFFAIYYFTMPKKECLFNRADGLVTFPGFMWHKNITMSIHKVLFAMSSPSMQGGGAFNLQIVRPDKTYSLWLCTLGMSCYEDLSFFLWYMDKNRPLPPGEGFDKYRESDFKRRKAEGFPKPLFESDFPTPEATQEQQKERELIGGW